MGREAAAVGTIGRVTPQPARKRRLHVADDQSNLRTLVRGSLLPVWLLELENRTIIEVSEPLASLLGGRRDQLMHRDVTDFAVDGALARSRLGLLVSGELDSYRVQSRKYRRLDHSEWDADAFVHAVSDGSPPRYALGVLLPPRDSPLALSAGRPGPQLVVLGSVDENWRIDRISSDLAQLLGYDAATMVGQHVARLVQPEDWPTLLIAIGQGLRGEGGATTRLHLRAPDGTSRLCRALVTPLAGAGNAGFGFAIAPSEHTTPTVADRAWELEGHLKSIAREVAASGILAGLTSTPTATSVPAMAGLSTRELEIVTALLAGDRVAMIAERMFLSESTVRNHLTSVYRKLGVSSQDNLLRALRPEQT